MGTRHPNHRRVKIHLTYSIEELARLFSIHKNTVRAWRKAGLRSIDDGRPVLFKGEAVACFLKNRRASAKQPCGPGRLYCLPCRKPMPPDGAMVDFMPSTSGFGTLAGLCPSCGTLMHRHVSRDTIDAATAGLDVHFPKGKPRISEPASLLVKCNFSIGEMQP